MNKKLPTKDLYYIEAIPLKIGEEPMPTCFDCKYADEDETCAIYTPIAEADLDKKLAFFAQKTRPRCLLLALPPEKFQGDYPIEQRDLVSWSRKRRSKVRFHLQAIKAPGPCRSKYPCGDEPACLNSPQLREAENEANTGVIVDRSTQIHTAIRRDFPCLSGEDNLRDCEIFYLWAAGDDPEETSKHIKLKDIAKALFGANNATNKKKITRVLEKAKKENPTAYARYEFIRYNRAKIVRTRS